MDIAVNANTVDVAPIVDMVAIAHIMNIVDKYYRYCGYSAITDFVDIAAILDISNIVHVVLGTAKFVHIVGIANIVDMANVADLVDTALLLILKNCSDCRCCTSS